MSRTSRRRQVARLVIGFSVVAASQARGQAPLPDPLPPMPAPVVEAPTFAVAGPASVMPPFTAVRPTPLILDILR